jgi:hypothetical protein
MRWSSIVAFNTETYQPLENASVYVYGAGSSTLASIFDFNGNPIDNPGTADSYGRFGFNVNNGVYDIQFTLGAYTSQKTLSVQLFDLTGILGFFPPGPVPRAPASGYQAFCNEDAIAEFDIPALSFCIIYADGTVSALGYAPT